MVEDWLDHEKHAVDVVHTGFEGWKRIQAGEYDLLILDWDLPDLNGIDILKRHRDAGGTTPVLMLTGRDSPDFKEMGFEAGADDYLTKPFHMKELSARVKALIRRAGANQPPPKPLGTNNQEVLSKANLAGTALAARYEFLEVLGQGGMGIVFKARNPLIDMPVAVKMLRSSDLTQEAMERFQREARAVCRLDHPNILKLHDFGITERGQPYMVMEFVEGNSLSNLLETWGAIPVDLALDLGIQICSGLAHAHQMGVLHRDIKPSNVMLKSIGGTAPVARILDFGFAKIAEPEDKDQIQLTKAGQVFGSPPYMSPEQVKGKPVDERTDIYSLGCVLYEMFSGCPPHLGSTSIEVMVKHLEENVTPLRVLRSDLDLPPELELVINRALKKQPEDRYQSAQELQNDLEQIRSKRGEACRSG